MSEITVLMVVLILAAAIVIAALLLRRKPAVSNNSGLDLLKTDLTELSRTIATMQQSVNERLDRHNTNLQTNVQAQLRESSRLVADVTQRLTKLDETNRRVVDVAEELRTLQNVLQNPKQRGVFGEFYLQSVLDNVLPPKHFQMQYKFKNGEIADAVIFLEKGQILPVDSKFSLENYNRMIEEKDKDLRAALLAKVKVDLKGRIDETSKYIRPSEKTMDFAFMFIPSEALYYDLLIGGVGSDGRDLIEYAFRDRRVIIVSPTSFMAYLQTVLHGLRSLQIEEQAKEIQVRVGQLGQHLGAFDTFMQKLGASLGTTVNHFNNAHKELKKVDKDVVKISGNASAIEPVVVDKPVIE